LGRLGVPTDTNSGFFKRDDENLSMPGGIVAEYIRICGLDRAWTICITWSRKPLSNIQSTSSRTKMHTSCKDDVPFSEKILLLNDDSMNQSEGYSRLAVSVLLNNYPSELPSGPKKPPNPNPDLKPRSTEN